MQPFNHQKSVIALIAAIAVTFYSQSGLGAEKLLLVENSTPKCVIVAADGIGPSEKTGIEELQKYIKEISGAVIEVKNLEAAKGTDCVKLVVGNKTVHALYPEVKLDDLGKEGFILKTSGNAILIAGGEVRGTMYAVYELLEKLGIRWWNVGETQIPKQSTVTLASLDERHIPKIEYRDALYALPNDISEEDNPVRIEIHNKMNGFSYRSVPDKWGGRFWYDRNLVHTHQSLMEPVGNLDGRFKTHPEYWALVNGKNSPGQVCPSNPAVFEIMKANVLKQIKEHPEYEFVVVGQEDNGDYCRCDACKALAESEGSPAAPYLLLANKLAEALEKEFSGKWVQTPAYTWSRTPPKTLKPRSNVGITLCSIECDFNRPLEEMSTPMNKKFAEDIISWGKIAPKLYIWDYTTDFDHYYLPFPNLDALVPNIKFFVKNGVRGILEQGSHTGRGAEFDGLRNWVLNRAMWNPDQPDNGETLIKEFVNGYYGPAGVFIQKYIDIIHGPGRANPGMTAGCYARLDAPWLIPEVIANAESALQQAEKAVANDPILLGRVRLAHLPVWYVLLKRGTQSKTWAATEAKVGKLDIVEMVNQFSKVAEDRGMNILCDGEVSKGFLSWIKAYAALAAKTPPLPPELQGADPKSYRLIHACQMDTRGRWWVPQEGASDGWVCEIPLPSWTVNTQFSAFDDVVPGKKYKVFVRVKTSEPRQDGIAFGVGLYKGNDPGTGNASAATNVFSKKIPASELADGKFHAFEVGEFVCNPSNGFYSGRLWVGTDKMESPKVFLDCIWLREVTKSGS